MPEASSSPQCAAFWTHCLSCLEQELPAQQFKTWILPLRAEDLQGEDAAGLRLVAPSNFHRQWLRDRYLRRIEELSEEYFGGMPTIEVTLAPAGGLRRPGTSTTAAAAPAASAPAAAAPTAGNQPAPISNHVPAAMNTGRQIAAEASVSAEVANYDKSRLNPDFTFDTLVTGRANDLARAAALQVAQNPGVSYNPLFIYGGVGLGKTHLIHALGNTVFKANPRAVIRYVHAEDYYADVVRAYQQKSFDVFKRYYRSLDVLIIDDIQFFNNKNRTQEEFFHAFNALTEAKKQIIITSDTYPKDVQGLEDRLISRFDWGLT
nr:ATP-binding protein [Zoogloea sp.]